MQRGVTVDDAAQALRALAGGRFALDHDVIEGIAARMWPSTAPAGAVLMTAGRPADDVFVITDGVVELRRPADTRNSVISTLSAGGVFGDVPLLLGRPHHLDAVAATEVSLVGLDAGDLTELLDTTPGLARAWSASLAARILETHERLGELLAGHLDHRLGSLLLRRRDTDGRVTMTQDQLARLLGVQRSSVNDAIRRLERRGLVKRGYGEVIVTDPSAISAMLAP
ncbi:MAG: Crp/Fnr family transcriptional regulator [Acidimicrobiales bacterium]